jgi:hypothetical protein
MTRLTQLFPPSTRYLADTGNSFAWSTHYLNPFDRRILDRRNRERGDSDGKEEHHDRCERPDALSPLPATTEAGGAGSGLCAHSAFLLESAVIRSRCAR